MVITAEDNYKYYALQAVSHLFPLTVRPHIQNARARVEIGVSCFKTLIGRLTSTQGQLNITSTMFSLEQPALHNFQQLTQ